MMPRGLAKPSSVARTRPVGGRLFGLALLVALLLVPGAVAQEAQLHYTRANTITIPFNTDPTESRIKQVLLYVSEDTGKSWAQVAAVLPAERSFKFNARLDGWYWFAVQIQDNNGGLHPPTLPQLRPGLKICLDTRPPQATLRGVQVPSHAAGVEWNITDENPDVMSLRLDYRQAGGANWSPLSPPQLLQGQFGFSPSVPGQIEIRLQARDKAGNTVEQFTTVQAGPVNPNPGPTPGPGPGGVGALPAKTPPGQGPSGRNVIYVNKRQVALNYKIDNVGKSDVSAVEVWYTEDGRSWSKYTIAPRVGPHTVELSQERRYGFTLVAVSGVGLADRRPMAGDPPQIWVEVDETKPVVQLLGVDVGQGLETGKMTIRWSANDRFLGERPIRLSYASEMNGPWLPIAETLPNDGRYVWQMPEQGLPFQMFVRIDATDLASNVGTDATPKPVAVDLKVPHATVIGIEPVAPGAGQR